MRILAARPIALLAACLIALAGCGGGGGDGAATNIDQPTDDQAASDDAPAETDEDADGQATDTGDEESSVGDSTDADGGVADLSCDDLIGAEQTLLDAAQLGAWTGDTMSFPSLCAIDGADGSASVFAPFDATPEDYFAANGYGEPSSDGDVVTATTEFGVPSAGTVVDDRVLMVTIDGNLEPRTTQDAAAVLRVALETLVG